MGNNLAFPVWKTADKIINHIVDDMFGVVTESKGTNLTLQLLPEKTIDLVPIEDRTKFQSLYAIFLHWLREKHAIPDLESNLYMPNDRSTKEQILHHIMQKFAEIEATYNMSIKEILKGIFGVLPYAFQLPEELKGIYEDDDWNV